MKHILISLLLISVFAFLPNAAFAETPTVFFTKDITPEGLMAIYNKLGREAEGKVAVKLSTGEAGNTHYLSPNLIGDLVKKVNGTIVECNTAVQDLKLQCTNKLLKITVLLRLQKLTF